MLICCFSELDECEQWVIVFIGGYMKMHYNIPGWSPRPVTKQLQNVVHITLGTSASVGTLGGGGENLQSQSVSQS